MSANGTAWLEFQRAVARSVADEATNFPSRIHSDSWSRLPEIEGRLRPMKAMDSNFSELLDRVFAAGRVAALDAVPSTMCVFESNGVVDVAIHGVCGGSRILVEDRRTKFARWLIRYQKGYADERCRCVCIRYLEPTQSFVRAAAFARAAVSVLVAAGIRSRAEDYFD